MWVRIQCSARCAVCEETTAVNAAIATLECYECGADLPIDEEFWRSALLQAVVGGQELDTNAMTNRSFDVGGLQLTLAMAAVPAVCPHCAGAWGQAPVDSCPHCQVPVSIRVWDGVSLVAEDQMLLDGEDAGAVPESVDCRGCGTSLSAGGDARELTCPSCSRKNVVPDPVWRRLHDPYAVATWWLYSDGQIGSSELSKPLTHISALCADQRHVYIVGGYEHSHVLIAMKGRSIAWTVDLEKLGPMTSTNRICCDGSVVYVYGFMSRSVHRFDAATGEQGQRIKLPKAVIDLCVGPNGQLLGQTAGGLFRADSRGAVISTWDPRSWFMALLPRSGARYFEATRGAMCWAPDGDLRVTAGDVVARVGSDGSLRWKVLVQGANTSIVPPAVGGDGSTWVVFRTVGGTMTVDDLMAATERIVSGETQSSSGLFQISADGKKVHLVRPSGAEEYVAIAVAADGNIWLARGSSELSVVDPQGALLWQLGRA